MPHTHSEHVRKQIEVLEFELGERAGVSREEVSKVFNALGAGNVTLPAGVKLTDATLRDFEVAFRSALTVVMC
jgi:hypothetical protein